MGPIINYLFSKDHIADLGQPCARIVIKSYQVTNNIVNYHGALQRLNIAFDSQQLCSNSPLIFYELRVGRAAGSRAPRPRGPGVIIEIVFGTYCSGMKWIMLRTCRVWGAH